MQQIAGGALTLIGFAFSSYSPEQADVSIAFQGPNGTQASVPLAMVWVGADWRFVVPPGGRDFPAGGVEQHGRVRPVGGGLMLAAGGIGSALGGVVTGLLGGVGSTVVSPIFDAVGQAVGGAAAWMVRSMASFWMSTPTPQLATGSSSEVPSGTVAFIQGHLWWYMTAAAVAGVLLGCGRMAWEQRADAGRDVLRGLAVFVATAGAGLTVIALATTAADEFSSWIITASTGGSFATEVGKLTTLAVIAGRWFERRDPGRCLRVFGDPRVADPDGPGDRPRRDARAARRGAAVDGGVHLDPGGAALVSQDDGWLVAFILYKPAAAIVYATAFSLSSQGAFGSGSVTNVITGLMLMVLAILALPALMKFIAPIVGATAAGSAGAVIAAGAGAAAAGAMLAGPTGALRGVATGASAARWSREVSGPAGSSRCGERQPAARQRRRRGGQNGSGSGPQARQLAAARWGRDGRRRGGCGRRDPAAGRIPARRLRRADRTATGPGSAAGPNGAAASAGVAHGRDGEGRVGPGRAGLARGGGVVRASAAGAAGGVARGCSPSAVSVGDRPVGPGAGEGVV